MLKRSMGLEQSSTPIPNLKFGCPSNVTHKNSSDSLFSAGGPCGVVAEAESKILTPYGDTAKILNSCKVVKILSEFFLINLDAQSKFMSAEATPRKVRLRLKRDRKFYLFGT
jgi:hypothetical protein